MSQSQHDELAQLFQQSMQLAQPPQQPSPLVQHVSSPSEKQPEPQVHYISSHYTGTTHMRPDTTSEPSRSPPPPYRESLMPEAMYELLRHHSIDPSALLPNQIHLFQNADHEQRLRLLELWRISPPSYPLEDHLNGTWTSTNLEREEALARARYERQQLPHTKIYPNQEEHMLDTHIPRMPTPEPISPIREPGEAAWPPAARMRVSSITRSRPQTAYGEPEPYIVNGYAGARHSKSIDPVWAAATGLWQAPTYAQAVEQQQQGSTMADQYGMYEQIRNHADWERMNEHMARERLGQQAAMASDYDMEL